MLDPSDPRNFTHWIKLQLVVALRFVDVFTRRPIDTPLHVTIPELGWKAVHSPTDSTYRFLVTEAEIPGGPDYAVLVEDPDQRYVSHENIALTLPWTASTSHTRADHLEEYVLWPTRKFRVPVGETALVGRLTCASPEGVDGLDVFLSPGVRHFPPSEEGLPPEIPFARSDHNGEFLFRLPDVSRETDWTSGSPIIAANPRNIEVQVIRGGVSVGPVAPPTFQPDPRRVGIVTFEIP